MPFEVPEYFSMTGESEMPRKWWVEFNDSALNRALDTALVSNFSVLTAWERLSAARAVVDRESSAFWPDLFAALRGETGSGQTAFEVNDNVRLDLTAEYEIDLWGRIRSAVDAERFRVDAMQTGFQAAAISLSAEFVLAWYRLAEAELQYSIAQDQVRTNEKVLLFLRSQFGSGQVRSGDILRQLQLVEASREDMVLRETEIQLLKNRLAVLSGLPPQSMPEWPEISLPQLPPLPQTGIPLELVQRRPDVRSAYFQLQAADRDLASAISSKYPRIAVSAQLSALGGGADNLFRQWAWSLTGNLMAPLFYGGRLRAEEDRNEAVRNQRLYAYGESVLIAFREVEDALVREVNQARRIESIEKQHELAKQAYEQLRIEYFNGLSNYLDVLTALEQEQQLRRNLAAERRLLVDFRVGLYRALAGGLETENLQLTDSGQ